MRFERTALVLVLASLGILLPKSAMAEVIYSFSATPGTEATQGGTQSLTLVLPALLADSGKTDFSASQLASCSTEVTIAAGYPLCDGVLFAADQQSLGAGNGDYDSLYFFACTSPLSTCHAGTETFFAFPVGSFDHFGTFSEPPGIGNVTATLTVTSTTTPEPSSLLLSGAGILGLAGLLRRRISR